MRYLGIKLSLLRWAGTPRISVSASQDSTHRFATTRCLHQMRRCKWRQWKGESIFRSEEQTSELQSLMRISYAVFCLKKQKTKKEIEYKSNQNTRQKK